MVVHSEAAPSEENSNTAADDRFWNETQVQKDGAGGTDVCTRSPADTGGGSQSGGSGRGEGEWKELADAAQPAGSGLRASQDAPDLQGDVLSRNCWRF